MTAPPIPCVWTGRSFSPLPRFHNVAAAHYGEGEVVLLAPIEERSDASPRHEFAWLREAWLNLPDELAVQYPSPEVLRKRALIATGWCTVRDHPCKSRAEADRLAATLRSELDAYTVVIVKDDVVRVCRARSQARNKMRKDEFDASKRAILEWVSNLLGVEPDTLSRAARDGGADKVPPVAA